MHHSIDKKSFFLFKIPENIDEINLRQYFSKFGPVKTITFHPYGQFKTATLEFINEDDGNACLDYVNSELNSIFIDGYPTIVGLSSEKENFLNYQSSIDKINAKLISLGLDAKFPSDNLMKQRQTIYQVQKQQLLNPKTTVSPKTLLIYNLPKSLRMNEIRKIISNLRCEAFPQKIIIHQIERIPGNEGIVSVKFKDSSSANYVHNSLNGYIIYNSFLIVVFRIILSSGSIRNNSQQTIDNIEEPSPLEQNYV